MALARHTLLVKASCRPLHVDQVHVTYFCRYKGFPNLKFVAHTGDETQPHGVWRVRDMVWGETLGDKGVLSVPPVMHTIRCVISIKSCQSSLPNLIFPNARKQPNGQAPCLVFVDSKGAFVAAGRSI
jgi:hypothetical protein